MYKSGKARSIGVSNYNTAHVQELVAAAEVKPMVNQVSLHTCMLAIGTNPVNTVPDVGS
jgi:diketogulonate reductase-like aldo/keto reductase